MKGDFSRLTGRKATRKHFNAVLKQQGRVQLDSDWNELISIIEHQRKVRTIDVIGQFGAPLHDSGFKILHPGNGLQDLLIGSGRFYAGGLLCETSPSSKLPIKSFPSNTRVSVDDTLIDGNKLKVNHWVQVITEENPDGVITQIASLGNNWIEVSPSPGLSTLVSGTNPYLRRLLLYSEQPDFPDSGNYTWKINQTDLIYLDVWERHVTAIEDPELREVALGGPDTETRVKVIAQVKILPNIGNYDCADIIPNWIDFLKNKTSNGRLTTSLHEPDAPDSPCELGESGGFHGLENRLYRVEIHDGDTAGNATFKWSRDNAAFAYSIETFVVDSGGTVTSISLKNNGKDNFLKIKEQDWIEISGDETDLNADGAGTLAKVSHIEGDIFFLDRDVSAHKNETRPKIRRWDISDQRPDVLTNIVTGKLPLEDGVEIEFSGSVFNPGEYWVFAARTLTRPIEILDREPPLGIKHHYCKLALVTGVSNTNVEIEDCRPEFPPLTEISGGCCTVTVGRHEEFRDIQLAIDSLKGGPGTVCIKPGIYPIRKPIKIQGKNITVKGCGGKPIIINTAASPNDAIIFQVSSSWDIDIHDLYCVSGAGARVVEVENTLWFDLHDCILIGGGKIDYAGIVAFLGLTLNTNVSDSILLGMVGLSYHTLPNQSINLHLFARAERNKIFALEHGVVQFSNTVMVGFDLVDNLMVGFGLNLLSRAFFPESLFKAADEARLFSANDMTKAAAARNSGKEFESVGRRNAAPVLKLENDMRVEAARAEFASARVSAANIGMVAAVEFPTLKPLVAFLGTLIDANITDNIMIGNTGIITETALELVIDKNVILAGQDGVLLGTSAETTLQNNVIYAEANGVEYFGQMAIGITLTNNMIYSKAYGFIAQYTRNNVKFQIANNIQLDKNFISASNGGIFLNNPVLFLWDLTIVDNSIVETSEVGISIQGDSGQFAAIARVIALQRIIQRNSITSNGLGIFVGVSSCEILDNVINIGTGQDSSKSRGIVLLADRCTISNNAIQAINLNQNTVVLGGIYLALSARRDETAYDQIDILHNKIIGGAQNGIEIGSNINGLVIEGNEIAGMGLNGIAVQNQVSDVNALRIAANHIHDCQLLVGNGASNWWRYAGIVLTGTRKTQITENVICNNGNNISPNTPFETGAFYAERVNEITISGNQFMNNGPLDRRSAQAVIHVPIGFWSTNPNADIQIVNNMMKSDLSPSLILGNYWCYVLNNNNWIRAGFRVAGAVVMHCFAFDSQAIISNNHFESRLPGPIVFLHISRCVFASNFVSAGQSTNSVTLGYGTDVMANGNVVSDPITGAGNNQVIINNLQF